jgi:putative transposase
VDLVGRNFSPTVPNRLWVADFTYCPTWTGMAYVAFVVDAFARRVVGWRAAARMDTQLVLDALDHALFTRRQEGVTDLSGLVAHSDAGSQYTSIALTTRLLEAGIDASVGTVGDALDNALAESTIGSFKTEMIHTTARGRTSPRSRWPPSSGSTSSTTIARTSTSTTSRPTRQRPSTTLTANTLTPTG